MPNGPGQAQRRTTPPARPVPPVPAGTDGLAAEASPAPGQELEVRRRRIDESLTRLTAAHAGMSRPRAVAVTAQSEEPDPEEVDTETSKRAGRKGAAGADDADPADGAKSGDRRLARTVSLRVGKVSAIVLAVVLCIAGGVGWGAKAWLNSAIRPVSALDPNSESIINAAEQVGDENFLLVGSDPAGNPPASQSNADGRAGSARPPRNTAPPRGTDAANGSGASRANNARGANNASSPAGVPGAASDVVMVAHISADRSRAVLVSFPRDLEVNRPPCQRWDPASATYSNDLAPAEAQTKLNSAFEVGGPRCVTRVIQQLTGLSITRFVGMDFDGFRDMVNAVQGVELCGPAAADGGGSTLSGDRVLDYLRESGGSGATADSGRIERQQRFISALFRKVLSNQVLLDPPRLRDFFTAFAAHSITDTAGADELLTLAQSFQQVDPSVTLTTVPTTGEPNALGNDVLRDADTKALFGALREGNPVPAPKSAGPAAPNAPQLDEVKLQVYNASDRSGLAGEVKSTLSRLGFTVLGVGNSTPTDRTVIKFDPDHTKQAELLAASVPAAVLERDGATPSGLQLLLGNGFDNVIKPPSGSLASSGTPGTGASCG